MARDSRCPFCGALQRETSLAIVLGLAAGVAACGPRVVDPEAESAEGSSTVSDETTTTTSGPGTTIPGTSASPTTTVGPGSTGVDTGDTTTDSPESAGFIYGGATTGTTPIECSIVDQDCGFDLKCSPWANDGGMEWNATHCVPATGEGQPGDPCTAEGSQWSGHDDCDVGSICWFTDVTTDEGVCVALCGDEGSECPKAASVCRAPSEIAGLCLSTCDPLASDCAAGLACVGSTPAVCSSPGEAAYGEACEQAEDCASGLGCAPLSTPKCDASCCTPFCDPEQPAMCPDAQDCELVDGWGWCA